MNEQLRAELLQMRDEDQAMRTSGAWDHSVDVKNTARLKDITAEHGWPGISLVGEDGAHAAWLLAQHADHDRDFQRQCLQAMEKAVEAGEASKRNWAYLVDRVRVAAGGTQLYGTQCRAEGAAVVPFPIEDETTVDERRASVGLMPLSHYLAMGAARAYLRKQYGDKGTLQAQLQLVVSDDALDRIEVRVPDLAIDEPIRVTKDPATGGWHVLNGAPDDSTLPDRPDASPLVHAAAFVEVEIGVEREGGRNFITLRVPEGRSIRIWIGESEAKALRSVFSDTPPARPSSYDLMMRMLLETGTRMEKVAITGIEGGAYLAEAHLIHDGRHIKLDSRPSDAINLAVRSQAPILLARSLLQEGQTA